MPSRCLQVSVFGLSFGWSVCGCGSQVMDTGDGCQGAPPASDSTPIDISAELEGDQRYQVDPVLSYLRDPGGSDTGGEDYDMFTYLDEEEPESFGFFYTTSIGLSGSGSTSLTRKAMAFSFDFYDSLQPDQKLEVADFIEGERLTMQEYLEELFPSRICVFWGSAAGSVAEGSVEKRCASVSLNDGIPSLETDEPDTLFEYCTTPSICGAGGVIVTLPGDDFGSAPTTSYEDGNIVGGFFVSDLSVYSLDAAALVMASSHLIADHWTDQVPDCVFYSPDEAAEVDDDSDGFYWYQVPDATQIE